MGVLSGSSGMWVYVDLGWVLFDFGVGFLVSRGWVWFVCCVSVWGGGSGYSLWALLSFDVFGFA